jgi:hypothetical protein
MCQIYVSTSSNAKVYGNTVDVSESGGDALIVVNMHRPPANPGINNEIYNNTFIIRGSSKGKVGVTNENEPDANEVFSNNVFHNNIYHLSDLQGRYFMWDGKRYTFAETQAASHEAGSVADINLPAPDPKLFNKIESINWPTLTEPPIDESLLNPALEAPGSGPALWFKLDDNSGLVASDFSGNNNSGTLDGMDGTKAWVTGHSGKALEFDGKDDCIKAGKLGMFRYLTISMFVNASDLEKEFNSLLHTDGWKKGSLHMMISGNGRIQFALNGNIDGGQYSEKYTFTNEDLGKWKHVAVVYDAQNKTVKFYINGKLNSTRTYTKTIIANLDSFQFGGWSGGHRNFAGKFDDIRIYGRALNEQEIAKLAVFEK